MSLSESSQILIVDDTPANLKLLSEILTRHNYQVRPASSGSLALKSVAIEKPDLILLDIKMPNMDGYEVCRRLKLDESSAKIPIIFISALDDTADKVKGFNAGGIDYITKPFQTEEILARIKTHLSLAYLQETLELRNIRLEQEIEDRKRAEILLEQKNAELEKAYAELKKVQMQFIQQEKLVAVGQLAAGVAHEINNPLGFINSNFTSLSQYTTIIKKLILLYQPLKIMVKEQSLDNDEVMKEIEKYESQQRIEDILEDLEDLISESEGGLKRISKIVTSLQTFAWHDNQNQYVQFDLNQGIKDALVLAHHKIKDIANLSQELTEIPIIEAIGGYINQVLLNLILNAAHAIKAKNLNELGQIEVKSWQSEDAVFCSVSDNGVGISPSNCQRIFEAFFTTKPVGEGTGLGLSTSYDIIVNKHNGELDVESKEGIGSVFTLKLPINRT